MAVLSDNKGNKVGNLFLQIVSVRERETITMVNCREKMLIIGVCLSDVGVD